MRLLFIFIPLFCFVNGLAQSFKYEAALPSVEADGFYRVLLSPKINVHLNDDISDIRIHDGRDREVPYIIQRESRAYYEERFLEYEILKRERKEGCCTSLVLRNAKRTPINNINLIIKNADVSREAVLSGSDDNKEWFVISEGLVIDPSTNSPETQSVKIVGFPWSNYEYYLLKIKDHPDVPLSLPDDEAKAYEPLNILKAGYYETQFSTGQLINLPVKLKTVDSTLQKKTYVSLMFNGLHIIDQLEIVVSGAKYYRRDATISHARPKNLKGEKLNEYFRQNFQLTSGRTAIIDMMGIRSNEFLIEIENEDNPPLTISEVKASQLNRYLTAWLKKGETYSLRFGQPELHSPRYDLGFFKDSIPKHVSVLEAGDIKVVPTNEVSPVSKTFFTSKAFIWIAIVTVMLVLGVMSVKMVRETSKAEEKK
jgi:hypothetical protein